MSTQNRSVHISRLTALLVVVSASTIMHPQTPAADTSPVGHWVAEHPSNGGIGSWWDFRPDGTLTAHVGAIVTSPITRSGDQTLTRVGPAPSATDPLLGKWKPNPPATPSTNPDTAAQQKIMANAILVFSADNTESIRIPFTSFEGTWDSAAHTFHIQNQSAPASYTFQRTGAKLTLGQPPDNKKTDTYIPDPIL
jgi:hypothetical protein